MTFRKLTTLWSFDFLGGGSGHRSMQGVLLTTMLQPVSVPHLLSITSCRRQLLSQAVKVVATCFLICSGWFCFLFWSQFRDLGWIGRPRKVADSYQRHFSQIGPEKANRWPQMCAQTMRIQRWLSWWVLSFNIRITGEPQKTKDNLVKMYKQLQKKHRKTQTSANKISKQKLQKPIWKAYAKQ